MLDADDKFREIIDTINRYLPSGNEALLDLIDAEGEIIDGAEFLDDALPFQVIFWEDKNWKVSKSGIVTHIHEIAAEETVWDLKTLEEAQAKFSSAKSDAQSRRKKGTISLTKEADNAHSAPITLEQEDI